MNKDITTLKVSAIQHGTVIDHIPAKNLFKVIGILRLDTIDNNLTIGNNLDSQRIGKKGIIKVSNRFFADNEINKIALVAPLANLNIIRDYQVVEKRQVVLPPKIHGIVKCVNPKCITNHEQMATRFSVLQHEVVALKCDYCEKITDQDNMVML
jgi:aspartate carbamoyltransferase regulatory subunit